MESTIYLRRQVVLYSLPLLITIHFPKPDLFALSFFKAYHFLYEKTRHIVEKKQGWGTNIFAVDYFLNKNTGMAIAFMAYALANLGFILANVQTPSTP